MGADIVQLRAIIKTKLLMDDRRKSPMMGGGSKSQKKGSGQQFMILLVNFFMGLALAFSAFRFGHVPTGLTLYFSAWMVLLSMTMITDFSDVLLDTKDNYILLPTPVNDKTLSISRILHILLYLFRQVIAFILPAMIYLGMSNGLGLLVFLIQSALVVVMTIFLVNGVYMLVMKFSSPDRFKNIINNLQIVFTILIFGAYYVLPELVDFAESETANIYDSPFSYLVPPAWIASIWGLTLNANFSAKILIHVVLAIGGTVGAFYFVSKYLSKDFNQKLLNIGQAKGSTEKTAKVKKQSKNRVVDWLASAVTFSKVENASFKFAMRFTGRDRMYKLKTYPALGYIPILFASFLIRGKGSFLDRVAEMQEGDQYLFMIYICSFLAITPLTNAIYTDKPGQSWIFRAAPVAHPKPIFFGMLKAIMIQFLLPVWLLMFAFAVWFWGGKVVDDFLLGGLIIFVLGLLICRRSFDHLPFSKPWQEMEKGSSMMLFFIISLGLAIVGGLHYFVLDKPIYMAALALVFVLATFLIYRSFDKLTWDKIQM